MKRIMVIGMISDYAKANIDQAKFILISHNTSLSFLDSYIEYCDKHELVFDESSWQAYALYYNKERFYK